MTSLDARLPITTTRYRLQILTTNFSPLFWHYCSYRTCSFVLVSPKEDAKCHLLYDKSKMLHVLQYAIRLQYTEYCTYYTAVSTVTRRVALWLVSRCWLQMGDGGVLLVVLEPDTGTSICTVLRRLYEYKYEHSLHFSWVVWCEVVSLYHISSW